MKFDEDIQEDLDNDNIYALACVAQDLRDTIKYINFRSYIAAIKRKQKDEDDESKTG